MNDPSSTRPEGADSQPALRREKNLWTSLLDWLSGRSGETARATLEELIVVEEEGEQSLGANERMILANILELRGCTVADVMVPRADIRALSSEAKYEDFVAMMAAEGHSRFPVYRGNLDSVLGMVHVKDVLVAGENDKSSFDPQSIVRPVMFVSPSMLVLELLLEMRLKRCHLALVVDEFGGIDGLVTIEDLVEEIVGEIEDEFDPRESLELEPRADGSWDASARVPVEQLEKEIGRRILSNEEQADIDTLGGLVFSISGRVPIRGELLEHSSGIEFEVLDAEPRRVKRLRIRLPRDEMMHGSVDGDLDEESWEGVDWAEEILAKEKSSATKKAGG